MKRLIRVLAMLCVMALGFCALAEQSATVTVRGIGENVTVTLVMEDEKIVAVEAASDNAEADERGVESLKLIADAMVEKNSVNVDAVSGATGTSNAVIAAATQAWLQIQAEAASGEDWMEAAPAGDTLYQVALLQSLVQGYYDGIVTVEELKQHGDTGIGTFEDVNGEMIVLDGTVYQAVADGSIAVPSEDETVPFSNVTFFDVDETLALSGVADMAALQAAMNDVVNELGANCFYMVKIEGTFDSIKVRSEYKQEKPYRALDVALAEDQTEFDYEDVRGTVVGLYCPDYMGGLNTPGWHFHFINEDRTRGGHVLQISVKEAEAAFDMTDGFEMALSRDAVFQDMELAKNVDEAIHKAETATVEADPDAPDVNDSFWISEITDDIFERIQGKSFKDDCTLPREDLRYLHVLHVDLNGETHEGEMIVNYHIAEDVLDILRQLYKANYPIEKIRLVDEYGADDELSMEDNNSSSFNFRFISHTTRVSKHGLGLAVDINTLYNPYTKIVDGERIVEPITGEPYLDREADFPYKIDHDDLCFKLFIEHGFEWGGDWEDRKDYQHFEIPTALIEEWYPSNE